MEIFEGDTPLIIEKREFLTDSGGPGKKMGGLGRRVVFRVPDDEYAPIPPVNLGIQSGRYRYSPEGLFGGKNGARARFLINDKDGNPYGLTRFGPGDVVIMDAAGGGGYGDPLERDLALVERDVADGYISVDRAQADYGAVMDPGTMKVDQEASKKLRASMKGAK